MLFLSFVVIFLVSLHLICRRRRPEPPTVDIMPRIDTLTEQVRELDTRVATLDHAVTTRLGRFAVDDIKSH